MQPTTPTEINEHIRNAAWRTVKLLYNPTDASPKRVLKYNPFDTDEAFLESVRSHLAAAVEELRLTGDTDVFPETKLYSMQRLEDAEWLALRDAYLNQQRCKAGAVRR